MSIRSVFNIERIGGRNNMNELPPWPRVMGETQQPAATGSRNADAHTSALARMSPRACAPPETIAWRFRRYDSRNPRIGRPEKGRYNSPTGNKQEHPRNRNRSPQPTALTRADRMRLNIEGGAPSDFSCAVSEVIFVSDLGNCRYAGRNFCLFGASRFFTPGNKACYRLPPI